jgi:hypothetical protein
VGNLIRREYYLEDAQLTNKTGATIDPGLKVEIGCITALGLGGCLYEEDFKTTGLININVFDETWGLGGFNSVAFLGNVSTNPGGTPGDGPTTSVPEPGSLFLLGGGLLLLVALRTRRTKIVPASRCYSLPALGPVHSPGRQDLRADRFC